MPKPRPEASGLADLVADAERRYGVAPLLLTSAAAKAIGVSNETLGRWRRDERLLPYAVIKRGEQAAIPLYSPFEIEVGQMLRKSSRPGPRPAVTTRATPKKKVKVFNADKAPRRAAQRRSAAR